MMESQFIAFHVKRYRSLLDVKLNISDKKAELTVICGENNIGKTNFLRALNVYFNHIYQENAYNSSEDIPHHIFYGSGGSSNKTELIGSFIINEEKIDLKLVFNSNGEVSYYKNSNSININEATSILQEFCFLFVESHNIDIPKLISILLEKDGLLSLDSKRKKQSEPLQKLYEFIDLSQKAISDIEKDINDCFKSLTDFDGILKDKKIKINFAEFEKLRDVVKTMTSITLYDGNNHGIAAKGSGAQRAVFLSLMQFISKNSKKNIIWGVDEPEAFLQPRLQKEVSKTLNDIAITKKQPVIITTHSQHFVNLNNLKSTHIFKGTISQKNYTRKPNRIFFEMSTIPIKCNSDFEKAILIKRHLGIANNDGWEVLPYNIIVEGEEDKRYLEAFLTLLELPVPNIIWSGGASKIAGYLQYYDQFSVDLSYKPKFICVFDNDKEGKKQSQKLRPKSYKYIDVALIPLPRYDGVSIDDEPHAMWEIEDFLPHKIMISVINKILKKDKYKTINASQIANRDKPAHQGKQLLKYAEECSTQNNPSKASFILDNDGRKKQICQILCEQLYNLNVRDQLTEAQIKFLVELAKGES